MQFFPNYLITMTCHSDSEGTLSVQVDVDVTDAHVRIPVGFEETTEADVDENVTELREVDGVQDTVTIRGEGNTNRPVIPPSLVSIL